MNSGQPFKYPAYYWNPEKGEINSKVFQNVDGIIHLAGANLADKRWTSKVKKQLIDSRVESTKLLSQTLEKLETKPAVFVSCSAVGFYGSQKDQILTEKNNPSPIMFGDEWSEWAPV